MSFNYYLMGHLMWTLHLIKSWQLDWHGSYHRQKGLGQGKSSFIVIISKRDFWRGREEKDKWGFEEILNQEKEISEIQKIFVGHISQDQEKFASTNFEKDYVLLHKNRGGFSAARIWGVSYNLYDRHRNRGKYSLH